MSRTFSLAALSTLLLATAVEAYSGSAAGNNADQNTLAQPSAVTTTLHASTNPDSLQGDNCGADGYPWLGDNGQPLES